MLGIVGLVLVAGCGGAAWWAFKGGGAGDASYDWVRAAAIIIGIIGILLLFLQIRKWWIAD